MSRLEDTSWETGWDGHQQEQLRRLAERPFADKLRWLEETHRLVRRLHAANRIEDGDKKEG